MEAVVQFEDRVKNGSTCYKNSANIQLSNLIGAEIEFYPKGEDEAGADVALDRKAAQLRWSGKRPYIFTYPRLIHLLVLWVMSMRPRSFLTNIMNLTCSLLPQAVRLLMLAFWQKFWIESGRHWLLRKARCRFAGSAY